MEDEDTELRQKSLGSLDTYIEYYIHLPHAQAFAFARLLSVQLTSPVVHFHVPPADVCQVVGCVPSVLQLPALYRPQVYVGAKPLGVELLALS